MPFNESVLEEIIIFLQQHDGHISSKEIPSWSIPDVYQKWGHIQLRLIHYGLITPDAIQTGHLTLTQKGWEFDGFEKERQKAIRQENLLNSNIAAAKAGEQVSTETVKFYEKQDSYNNTQKKLTIFIMLSAAVSALAATFTFISNERNSEQPQSTKLQQVQSKVQSLDSALQSQIKIDSSFQRAVSDSLKMPRKSN